MNEECKKVTTDPKKISGLVKSVKVTGAGRCSAAIFCNLETSAGSKFHFVCPFTPEMEPQAFAAMATVIMSARQDKEELYVWYETLHEGTAEAINVARSIGLGAFG